MMRQPECTISRLPPAPTPFPAGPRQRPSGLAQVFADFNKLSAEGSEGVQPSNSHSDDAGHTVASTQACLRHDAPSSPRKAW